MQQGATGALVPVTTTSGVLLVPDHSQQLADYEKRLRDATALEEKLNKVQEEVPTRIYNVSGSCAGAGSGDFHYYRQIRRAEQDRLRRMDAEEQKQKEVHEFETKLKQRQEAAAARSAKKRNKRQKKKDKKKAAKLAKAGDGDKAAAGGSGGDGGASCSESSEEEQPELD